MIFNQDKLLIKNTTKEERKNIIYNALKLVITNEFNDNDINYIKMYIEGKIELLDALNHIKNNYKRGV